MRVGLFLAIALFFSSAVLASVEITEVMYNPQGKDDNFEFVEIFSDELVNLTGFVIGDEASNDPLEQLYSYPGNYSLIVEEEFDYNNISASIYSIGKTIGNNLND